MLTWELGHLMLKHGSPLKKYYRFKCQCEQRVENHPFHRNIQTASKLGYIKTGGKFD